MTDDRFERADRLLRDALDLTRAERGAFLDRECGGDGELRALVERLLAAAETDSEWLAPGADLDVFRASPPPAAASPERIGPYAVRERIGSGGFGDVYLADQTHPVRRRVALKVLKRGLDTRSVLARFEAEAQALALMDHPNIARVFDAGETEAGLPFFALEYVPGLAITEYCERRKLGTRERLELFVSVCRAVQHAHSRGIIHRDLKPSNILVSEADGQATPKVIDFGIAKATTTPLTERTIHTQHGQIMGTPAYMSPEQIEAGALAVDVRTDVWSLGVILYELLTGRTPIDPGDLDTGGLEELQRRIREDDPAKPSTRAGEAAGREIRGELDWITMKALEKDRSRRYETASAFAADVGRYLGGEAVEAGPPSTMYRFSKFARRHKLALGAAAAVLLGTVVAAGALVYALVESNRQRARVEAARSAAEAVTSFVTGMLSSADPSRRGREVTVVEVLDQAAAAVPDDLRDRPAIEARVRETLGLTYLELGELDAAVAQLGRAAELNRELHGDDAPATLVARRHLATAWREHGELDRAEEALRDLLHRTEGTADSSLAVVLDQLGTVLTLQGRYEEAGDVQARADSVGLAVFGATDPRRAEILANLGVLHRVLGRFEAARAALEEALGVLRREWGDEHPDTMNILSNLANVHYQLGEYEEAVERSRELAATKARVLGDEHPSTLQTRSDWAVTLNGLGRHAEAESIGVAVLEARRRTLGPDHPSTLQSMNNVALTYRKGGRPAEAEPLLRESLATKERVLGPDHQDTIITRGNLGDLLTELGRPEEALPLLEAALASARRSLPEDHARRNDVLRKLGECLRVLGRDAEAEAALVEAWTRLEAKLGPEHANTRAAAASLAALCDSTGRPAEAAQWRAKADATSPG